MTELPEAPRIYEAALASAKSLRLQADNIEVQMRSWGSGELCILLLHGGYGSWAHWIRVVPGLTSFAEVLAPDMPGFGLSDTPRRPHTAESVAIPLANAVKQMIGDRPLIIAGFSFGGAIAGHVAALLSRQVYHLMLVGPGGLGAPRGDMQDLIRRTPEMSRSQIIAAHRRNLEILMVHNPLCVDELALFIQENNTRLHRLKSRSISATDTLARILVDIKCPVSVLFGEFDASVGVYRPEREAILKAVLSDVEIEVVPNVGHWLMWENSGLVIDRLKALAMA